MSFNNHFIVSCFLIDNIPEGVQQDDFLSDMDDGYQISYFIKSYPGLSNIKFKLIDQEDSAFKDVKCFGAYVEWEDYKKWTEQMKEFWNYETDNDYFKSYLKRSVENGMTTISARYNYDSDEMNSLLIDPENF